MTGMATDDAQEQYDTTPELRELLPCATLSPTVNRVRGARHDVSPVLWIGDITVSLVTHAVAATDTSVSPYN